MEGDEDWHLSAYSAGRSFFVHACQCAVVAVVLFIAQYFVQLPSPWAGIVFAAAVPLFGTLVGYLVFPRVRNWLTVGHLRIAGPQLRLLHGKEQKEIDTSRGFRLQEARVKKDLQTWILVTLAQGDGVVKFAYNLPKSRLRKDSGLQLPDQEEATTAGALDFDPRAEDAHEWLRAQHAALWQTPDSSTVH